MWFAQFKASAVVLLLVVGVADLFSIASADISVLEASGNLETDDDNDWSLSAARSIVLERHALQPSPYEVPDSKVAFVNWLQKLDAHAEIIRTRPADPEQTSLGLLEIQEEGVESLVVVPLLNGPAWKSGLQAPVELSDSKALQRNIVTGHSLETGEDINIEIRPDRVRAGEVKFSEIGDFTVLRVTGFVSERTFRSAKYVLTEYANHLSNNANALARDIVLDLRYCAGGDVFEATDFAGLWMPERQHWVTLKNVNKKETRLETGGKNAIQLKPLAVIVSRHTASACEQLTLGLKTYLNTQVLGDSRTAGKCSVQSTIPLSPGYKLKITSGQWEGASRQPCDSTGIDPDQVFTGNIHNRAALASWLKDVLTSDNTSSD